MPTVTNATILTQRFESTQATGVSPLVVASTTVVANLNADLLDGLHAAAFALTAHSHAFADLTAKPTTLAGYGITDAAAAAHTHTFASLTSKPTTVSGYGITDAADVAHTHTFASLTSKPTTLVGYGITDALTEAEADALYLALGGGTLTGALLGTSLSMSGAAAIATHVELTNASTPSNPAATKARIFWDNTAGAVKAVNSAGTVITLGTIGGAITDAYSAVAGDSGTASASGGAQLSVLGAGGITTAAADGTPDTLTITLGNHSAALLTSGTLPDARIQATGVTQHQASLSVATTQLTGDLAVARFNGGTGASSSTYWRGDGTWVAAGGTMVLLATGTLASGAFDFTSIPATYKHLRIVITARTELVTTSDNLLVQVNGDTGTNYDSQNNFGNGATSGAVATPGATSGVIGRIPGDSADANDFGCTIIDIPNYASTAFWKSLSSHGGAGWGSSSGNMVSRTDYARWKSTAAISRVFLFAGGDFTTGAVAHLYGIG